MGITFKKILAAGLAFCLACAGSAVALAQSGQLTVRGKVVDQSGLAVPGATVVVAGTLNGTTAGPDGTYTLSRVASRFPRSPRAECEVT